MIQKILVANRGEIARRVIRTARKMGIQTVSIYSEADLKALHRQEADESYLVGPAPSVASYLNQDRILEIARISQCDAIHPGYGFLSENEGFAQKVKDEGLIWIGPSPDSIRLMGDKLAAKKLAASLSVPMLPGTNEPISDLKEAKLLAKGIGYPILLKAAGGGGGKGMRIVDKEEELEAAFQLAASEAGQSFADTRVFIEKYLEAPKHIEIQIMGDQFGNVVHLFERDCSVQRRHQKVIEESPGPMMTQGLRDKMTAAAIKLAHACQYVGAGTVEFLVEQNESFYFLEMNTRLQVEHPVTEYITGLDLVEWQIDIANGKKLPLQQDEVTMQGHSIQLRVYAEDILDNFTPSLGQVLYYKEPQLADVRIDGAVKTNFEVPIYYDPMIAKLIVWGKDRQAAIHKILEAITDYHIYGIQTTLPLGNFVFQNSSFKDGNYDTHFLQKNYSPEVMKKSLWPKVEAAAFAIALERLKFINKPQENMVSEAWRKARR